MNAEVVTVETMSDVDREDIVSSLTKPGSEFQVECQQATSDTPVALVRLPGVGVVAWAAAHTWRGLRTIQGFTRETHRRLGFGRIAAFILSARGAVNRTETVAVFSPEYAALAKSIGCSNVRTFGRAGSEWVEICEPSGGPAPRVVG